VGHLGLAAGKQVSLESSAVILERIIQNAAVEYDGFKHSAVDE
jgi:hypothetical protein